MNAMIRTSDDPVPAPLDGAFLAAAPFILNLVTDFGDVDLTFSPSVDFQGFADWRAANRTKDQRDLPYLESLRDQRGQ